MRQDLNLRAVVARGQGFPRGLAELEGLGQVSPRFSTGTERRRTVSDALAAREGLSVGQHLCAVCLGRSAGQSFCDRMHEETELTTVVFEAEHDGTADLCGCKTSQGRLFCGRSRDRL